MIGSLRGTVLDREMADGKAPEVLLEVGGVGYRVQVTPNVIDQAKVGDEMMVHVHHHIRENAQKLYGFSTKQERAAFEGLIAAHGVGPALALAVLTTHPGDRLSQILADDDITALCEVPGVGKKTAQRVLMELKSTLVLSESTNTAIDIRSIAPARPSAIADVREALAGLGYNGDEIAGALAVLPTDELEAPDADAGRLLRQALRALAGS